MARVARPAATRLAPTWSDGAGTRRAATGEPTARLLAWWCPAYDRGDGPPAVLKVALPDDESEHEPLAPSSTGAAGRGAAAPRRPAPRGPCCSSGCTARTSDRCGPSRPARSSRALPAAARPGAAAAAHRSRRTSSAGPATTSRSCRATPRSRAGSSSRPRLGSRTGRDPASTGTMIHSDLHYENVLAGDREPWLVIDPQADVRATRTTRPRRCCGTAGRRSWRRVTPAPRSGDASTRWSTPRASTRTGPATGWSSAGPQRHVGDPGRGERRAARSTRDEREWITLSVAIVKAVQDAGQGPREIRRPVRGLVR